MNKLTKSAIAGAAGIALLLGGAGSLAYWNSDASLTGGTVSSGTLTITAGAIAPADITYSFNGGAASVFNPATNKIVPGDTVTMKQPVTITAVGEHLKADLTIDKTLLVGALATNVNVTVVAKNALNATVNTTNMDAATAASITYVTVTIAFPNTVSGTTGQTGSVTLGDVKLNLVQHA